MCKAPFVFRYRIRNWPEYNRALINRGRLTVWFDEQVIAAWRNTEPGMGPGAPRVYSDLAIECALIFKSVYHLRAGLTCLCPCLPYGDRFPLPWWERDRVRGVSALPRGSVKRSHSREICCSLRAAQGFLSSVMELMQLTLPIPDYCTVSRRQGTLPAQVAPTPVKSPRHVVIDATGVRVYGAGEWRGWKHRVSRRRTWRKLHLGIDESTREIVAVELTASRVHDSQVLPSLLEQIPDPIERVSGDGAYDTRACYEAVLQRGATPTFVPRCTAQAYATPAPPAWRAARNHTLQQIKEQGRYVWRVISGSTRQSIAENAMFRFKPLFGGRLWARSVETQRTEARIKCAVLNRMTQLGMPDAVRMG